MFFHDRPGGGVPGVAAVVVDAGGIAQIVAVDEIAVRGLKDDIVSVQLHVVALDCVVT